MGAPDEHRLAIMETGRDDRGSIVAVKIGGAIIGDFWFCLSATAPFDPGDGLPVYRPSEIRALKAKGYRPEALPALHAIKTTFEGTVIQ